MTERREHDQVQAARWRLLERAETASLAELLQATLDEAEMESLGILASGGLDILLVDDDPLVHRSVSAILVRLGHRVISASERTIAAQTLYDGRTADSS